MDFDACLELLAARPAHAHDHCEKEPHDHNHEDDVQAVTKAVESSLTLDNENAMPSKTEDEEALPASVSGLGREFFALQERRVQIYSDFQDGFNKFKATPAFQPFCATITVRFGDVSKRVNAIEAALRGSARPSLVLAQLIRKIQSQEKEKLLLTSALFVEKMRVADMAARAEPDESILSLLEKSVVTMTAKHTAIVEQINELLDAFRMELVDLDDEDDE